jgi:hypothetical protein
MMASKEENYETVSRVVLALPFAAFVGWGAIELFKGNHPVVAVLMVLFVVGCIVAGVYGDREIKRKEVR